MIDFLEDRNHSGQKGQSVFQSLIGSDSQKSQTVKIYMCTQKAQTAVCIFRR